MWLSWHFISLCGGCGGNKDLQADFSWNIYRFEWIPLVLRYSKYPKVPGSAKEYPSLTHLDTLYARHETDFSKGYWLHKVNYSALELYSYLWLYQQLKYNILVKALVI